MGHAEVGPEAAGHDAATRYTEAKAPGGIPLLGHALALKNRPFDFLAEVRPLADVVEIRLGTQPVFVVNHLDLIREILIVAPKSYDKGSVLEKASAALGNGIACSSGAFHLKQRRLMQPAFHHSRFAGYSEIMVDVARRGVAAWEPGQRLALDEELHDITLGTVAGTLFSTELGEHAVAEVKRSLPVLLAGATARALSPLPFLEKLPLPANRRFDEARSRLSAVILDIVDSYRAEGVDHGDFLSILVQPDPRTGERMSDRQVHDEAITLLMAGAETSASMTAWAFHRLAQEPEVEERMLAEFDTVLGDRPITYADVAKLTYTRQVLSEVMRLHSPPLIFRRSLTEVRVGNRVYPPRTQFFVGPHALQRDARFFADPERFDPDRWSPKRVAEVRRDAYIPFGAGVHLCLGDNYAWHDMAIILATALRRFRFVPVPGEPVVETFHGITRPNRLPMIVEPRPARPARPTLNATPAPADGDAPSCPFSGAQTRPETGLNSAHPQEG
jgi:cytochrome P450